MEIFGYFRTKNCQLSMNFHVNSKNKKRKNQKIDFPFDSPYCAYLMKMGAKLRERGSAYPNLGQGLVGSVNIYVTCIINVI